MAMTGTCITFRRFGLGARGGKAASPVYGPIISSESPATGVATTMISPAKGTDGREILCVIYPAADSYYTHGVAPDDPAVTTSKRAVAPGLQNTDFFIPAGHKVRWSAA